MDATTLRTYGTIAISVLVCLIFVAALVLVVVTKDVPSPQLLIGALVGAFSTVVGFFVGSSASSAQKDEKMLQPPPPPEKPHA